MPPVPFRSRPDRSVEARLGEAEARALRRVAADLIEALGHTEEPSLRRLFPPAYEDARMQEQFAGMTRDDLLTGKVAAARAVVDSIDAGTIRRGRWHGVLDEETAGCWLRVVNDARLVLGTRLDVTEDMDLPEPDDPRAPTLGIYHYLSWLEEMLIDALVLQLPEQRADDA